MRRGKLLSLLILLLAAGCLQPEMRGGPSLTPAQPTNIPHPEIVNPVVTPSIYYVVQPGDTLSKIAAEYDTTVAELVALNRDRYPSLAANPSLIRIGWELRLPESILQTPGAQGSQQVKGIPLPSPTVKAFDIAEAEEQIVRLVNRARAEKGLPPLAIDLTLMEIALQRSRDMIERNYFSHYDPETGETLALKLFAQRGYANYTGAENIGLIQNEVDFVPPYLTVAARYNAHEIAQRFVQGWLESPEHRENIFCPEFRGTGVGIAISPDGRRIVATQLFLEESY